MTWHEVERWAGSDLPGDGLLCESCSTGGPNLVTWTVAGEVVKVMHGACLTQPYWEVTDELAARRAR